jgi:putative endonuclease
MAYFIYMLRCADGTLYTGYTTDIEERLKKHNGHLPGGAKYTKGRRPVALVYSEEFVTRGEALRREHALKQLTREEKMSMLG